MLEKSCWEMSILVRSGPSKRKLEWFIPCHLVEDFLFGLKWHKRLELDRKTMEIIMKEHPISPMVRRGPGGGSRN